jgi:hypothetical protein
VTVRVWVERARPAAGAPTGAVLAAVLAAGAVLVGLAGMARLPLPLCYFKAVTGLPCFTCGSTRMLDRLFHLDLAGALAMNPLAAVGALVLVGYGLADLGLRAFGRSLRFRLAPPANWLGWMAVVVAVLGNWAYLIAAGR